MKIIYTHTDEAPALATQSLLPIVRAFAGAAGVEIELRDISLAGRILAQFPDRLERRPAASPTRWPSSASWRTTPEANIIKLPNISASVPQLKAAIAELQDAGLRDPRLPRRARRRRAARDPRALRPRSRAAPSTRSCARATPTAARRPRSRPTRASTRTRWAPGRRESRSHVATMSDGDFRSTEQSVTVARDGAVRIEHVARRRRRSPCCKRPRPGPRRRGGRRRGDAPRGAASAFLAEQIADAKRRGRPVLGPPEGDDDEGLGPDHLRPRRPRVSSPTLFAEHGAALAAAGVNPNDGLARAAERRSSALPEDERAAIQRRDRRRLRGRPGAGDGRLRPRHHQPARPERRDHRRLDAGRDPRLRARCGTRAASSRTRSS